MVATIIKTINNQPHNDMRMTKYNEHKKCRIQDTLTLLTCADNSIVSKKLNKIFGSDLEHLPVFKALRGDNSRVKHLPCMEDPRVQSGTTSCWGGLGGGGG